MTKTYKKVLLLKVPHCIHPATSSGKGNFRQRQTFRPVPSLALAALSAFLKEHDTFGYDVQAVDVNIEAYEQPGCAIDTGVYPDLLERIIRCHSYDVLALSTMFVFNAKWMDSAVRLSRRYHPEAKIISGGGYPTIFPKQSLDNYPVDAVVIGEGESTLVHILNRFNHHHDEKFEQEFPLDGYGEKTDSGKVVLEAKKRFLNMDTIPPPDWPCLNVKAYFKKSGERVLPMEAVRGCPYHCTFCNTQLTWGYTQRYKTVDAVIEEMKAMERDYSARPHFIDDNRSINRSWMISFLHRIIEENIPLESAPSSFHANHLDDELLDLLKQSGVKTVGLGVESGCPEWQKRLKKNINLQKLKELVHKIKSKKLRLHANYILGFPGESLEQIQETLDLARELKAHSNQFVTLVPYPSTEIYEEARKQGLLAFDDTDPDSFTTGNIPLILSDEWTDDQLSELAYDVNIDLNFLNNPDLSDGGNRVDFQAYLERLLLRIPGHVIALLILGFLNREQENPAVSERWYRIALKSLEDKEISETFRKYLSWDHPVIDAFREFVDEHNAQTGPLT